VLPGKPEHVDGGLAFTGTGAPETRLPRLIEAGAGTSSSGQFCRRCGAWLGCLGNEPQPGLYVQHMVEVFREVKRVLRDDGSVFLNLGDSYFGDSPPRKRSSEAFSETWDPSLTRSRGGMRRSAARVDGLKAKDLVGIPWMVAFALRDDGWWLRNDSQWIKDSAMPESVRDRMTVAHEYLFLLAKSKTYFYDSDAMREPHKWAEHHARYHTKGAGRQEHNKNLDNLAGNNAGLRGQMNDPNSAGRNRRTSDVWRDSIDYAIARTQAHLRYLQHLRDDHGLLLDLDGEPLTLRVNPKGYKGAHFAVFPEALVEPCIKAGTSERGVCPNPKCGAPWERVVERKAATSKDCPKTPLSHQARGGKGEKKIGTVGKSGGGRTEGSSQIIGWRPTCIHYPKTDLWQEYPRQERDESDDDYARCMEPIRLERQRLLALWEPMETVPALVLDPFVGSGTTLVVARALGRHVIGLDLNYLYLKEQATPRLGLDRLREWGERPKSGEGDPLADLPLFSGGASFS